MRSVLSRLADVRSFAALLSAAVVFTACTDPADARRGRHHRAAKHRPAGGGYNPPYADIVVDVKSGRVLHAVNEDALRHPASVTKVMTLYMLFEQIERGRYDLDSPLTISANAASMSPSKLGLRPGSTIEVEDAIKAIVTKSANDVACAIGENIAGSEPAFAAMMTRKARALGMSRTNYANASGLPDPDQVTTARDLAILAQAIQDRFPRYFRYFQTRSFAFRGRTIGNHNHLLGRVEGVDGIKTGYTRDSGFNLMTSAKLGDRQIVAIVLGGKSGGSRDAIMAGLVRQNLPRAFAGSRQTAPVVETAERGRPAVVADAASKTRTRVAEAEGEPDADDVAFTHSTGLLAPMRDTTTPAARWRTGAQAYAGPAGQAPFPAPAAKSETKSETRPETAARSESGKSLARLPSADGAGERSALTAKLESLTRAAPPTPWVIQLGAMDDEAKAKATLSEARAKAGTALSKAMPYTVQVTHGGTTLYRARFSGFAEQGTAQEACTALKRSGFNCFATRS